MKNELYALLDQPQVLEAFRISSNTFSSHLLILAPFHFSLAPLVVIGSGGSLTSPPQYFFFIDNIKRRIIVTSYA